jgi:hypothetical protein
MPPEENGKNKDTAKQEDYSDVVFEIDDIDGA